MNDNINDLKKCSKCQSVFPKENFNRNASRHDGLNPYCKKCHLADGQKRYNILKDQCFAKYGNKCLICEITDKRILQFDHIQGGGVKDIRNSTSPSKYYKSILEDNTNKFQLLCANHNHQKRYISDELFYRKELIKYELSEIINEDNKNYKKCGGCQLFLLKTDFYSNKARTDGLAAHCPDCRYEIIKDSLNKIRNKCLEKYGASCKHCGYNKDIRILMFDHVNSNGRDDKEINKTRNNTAYLNHILEDNTGKFQVLCPNCNILKVHTHDERSRNITFHPEVDIVMPNKLLLSGEERKLYTNYDYTGHGDKLKQWRENNPEEFEARNENISKARTGKKYSRDIV